MGIKQTLAAVGLSAVAAFSGAQAQQTRTPTEKHCLGNIVNTAALAKVLFATPVEKWNDAFLSAIGSANMVNLTVTQTKALEKELIKDIADVGRNIFNQKKAVNWVGLRANTHPILHEKLQEAEQDKWDTNKWTNEAKLVASYFVYKVIPDKLNSIRQVDTPALCPLSPQ